MAALEPLLATPGYPPAAGVLAARALLGEGDTAKAAYRYFEATSRDASVADQELEAKITGAPAPGHLPPEPWHPPARPPGCRPTPDRRPRPVPRRRSFLRAAPR
ncbi:hypothetical protein ACFQQB_19730 [Nonomuraea rubra]|uniref:hypothetical protein n=1 Tax=Nonomuraea rubra TaxID=46180 RepID=UPI003611A37F